MKKLALLFCLSTFCYGADYAPWFCPPLLFQADARALYAHKPFDEAYPDIYSLQAGLRVTPWPYWQLETEIWITSKEALHFQYESALLTLRYAWRDDIQGDPFTFVTGFTLNVPGGPFLHDERFLYPGDVNCELHATLGKEWARNVNWLWRIWFLAGYGVANKGSPWWHFLGTLEWQPVNCLSLGGYSEAFLGLGNEALSLPFNGYGPIAYRDLTIGGKITFLISEAACLRLLAWMTPYSRNFVENSWGVTAQLSFPFSVL